MKMKKVLVTLLALAMAAQPLMSSVTVKAEETGYVTDAQLTAKDTEAPTKDEVVPNVNQYEYQKQELAAFCHFGPNTFNEIEWGESYGDRTPDDIFKLEDNFDAETLVKTLKEAGFQKLIVTAKHHDGFCIWNSEYTTYDVESTSYAEYNYDNMGGDVLSEVSAACTKYDMDMGLYLSPWDIHEPSYGYYDADGNPTTKDKDVLDYNDYYNNQLQEILGNDKYGNNGHFNEVWMDGAKGSGANAQDYDFVRWFNTIQENEGKAAGYDSDCMLFGAEAYTTVRWIGNESGYANEETWAKSKVNYDNNTIDSRSSGGYTIGYEDGNKWTVPEADARITSGWFWGNNKKTPKTVEALAEMYFRSVGHNSTLLLNVPPNNTGTVDQAILDRVTEFGENVRETFRTNMAKDATVSASAVRGNDIAYKPSNVLDGDDQTYWTVNDGTTSGTLLVDFGTTRTFDVVSIEEAIQFGQRIKEFKIEYHNGDGEWKTFDEGTTVGAKRLSRKSPVKADQLRITVKTSRDVPMISEVGVYKASAGFELAAAAPDGMDIIDINDTNFTFGTGWTAETGNQYLNNTNKWANPGTYFEVEFTGSKIYLIGTCDPNHGTADVLIDGTKVATIDTGASSRAVGQIIFESEDLTDGQHTLRLETKTKAIGIEGAYVIDNDGVGMIGIENAQYTMDEDSEIKVKLVRVGGTEGKVTVTLSPNPGSAIQDDYDTECITTVTFGEEETEKLVKVRTSRNTKNTGNQYFTIELSTDNKDVILGFYSVAKVNINDTEAYTTEKLQELVTECQAISFGEYTMESWAAFAVALDAAEGAYTPEEIQKVYQELLSAKEALVMDEAAGVFEFPTEQGKTSTLEAENATRLENTGNESQWYLQIGTAGWASGGKFLNCLNRGDKAYYEYNAPAAGTYRVVVTYRSGAASNYLAWSEENNKITAGTVSAGNTDASVTKTVEFEMNVTEAGVGTLIFAPTEADSPQIDKFDITRVSESAGDTVCDHTTTVTVNNREATCTEAAYTGDTVCTECGQVIQKGHSTTGALGHEYGAWKTTREATCTEQGTKEQVCARCGDMEAGIITVKEHVYGEWITVKEPTVDEEGQKEAMCEMCGDKKTESVPKLEEKPEGPEQSEEPEQPDEVDTAKAQEYYDKCLKTYVEGAYTVESWITYTKAMEALKAALADKTITAEDLQAAVDEVKSAVKALVVKQDVEDNGTNTDNKDKDDVKDSVQTGDTVSVIPWMILIAVAFMIFVKRLQFTPAP